MSTRINSLFGTGCRIFRSSTSYAFRQSKQSISYKPQHIFLRTTPYCSYYEQRKRLVDPSRNPNICYLGYKYFGSQSKESKKLDTSSKKSEAEAGQPEENKSLYQKLKFMYKNYWYVVLPVHLATSTVWFGSFYYIAASGVDIASILEALSAPESWIASIKSSKAGNIVVAYTLYKIATPIRYTVTLGGTTVSINYLKKWGWIKPAPNKDQIIKIYEDKKGALKDLKTSYQDKMQVKKEEILKTKDEIKQQYVEAKEGFQRSVLELPTEFKDNMKIAKEELSHIGKLAVKEMKEVKQTIKDLKKTED